jgi:5-(carboxyamino)imidazole ribonucleotide synthase
VTVAGSAEPILPGGTLGILGGGQLGAMFAAAAKRMGYRVEAISDVADCTSARSPTPTCSPASPTTATR